MKDEKSSQASEKVTAAHKNFSNLLKKEIRLASSPLSFIFIAFSLMAFIPGYPITLSSYFICLGIFYSFQSGRESNDIIYSVLLPIAKKDVVTARYLLVIFIQLISLVLMLVFTIIRMTILKDAAVYVTNPLQNANLFFIAYCLLIFALFNLIFVRGYFKTAWYFAKPFVAFIVVTMILVIAFEIIPHLPALGFVSETGFFHKTAQICALCAGAVIYAVLTFAALKSSQKKFEMIDL